MVELVDNHDIEVTIVNGCKAAGGNALDGCEDMVEVTGPVSAHPELSKTRIAKDLTKRIP